jgi:hypothetical protein
LTGANAKTAYTKEAPTAGANAHTTYGRKNYSKPKQASRLLTSLTAQLTYDKNQHKHKLRNITFQFYLRVFSSSEHSSSSTKAHIQLLKPTH